MFFLFFETTKKYISKKRSNVQKLSKIDNFFRQNAGRRRLSREDSENRVSQLNTTWELAR